METQYIKLSLLQSNTGQIEGLPKNPRTIRDEKFRKLLKSITDDPEMLEMRELLVMPHEGYYVLIGGNMRLKAMRELGYKEAPCKVLPADTPVEKLKAYTTKDNVGYGDWNFDDLAKEWGSEQMEDWGLEIPQFEVKELQPSDHIEIQYNDSVVEYKVTATFKSSNKFGMPDFPLDVMYDGDLSDLDTLTGKTRDEEGVRYLYNMNSTAFNHVDTKKLLLGFYARDFKFDRVYEDIDLYVDKFEKMGVWGVISPNFSLNKEDPYVLRMFGTFKGRWVARYFSKAGFKVIIDIEMSMDKDHADLEHVLAGLPIGMPWVSMQCQQAIPASEEKIWVDQFNKCFDYLQPKRILCYGQSKKEFVLRSFPNRNITFIPTINEKLKLQTKK